MKDTIQCVIKAPSEIDTAAFANRRGIPPIVDSVKCVDKEFNHYSFECNRAHIEAIRSWFNEDPGKAPYPMGTLLYYQWPEEVIEA